MPCDTRFRRNQTIAVRKEEVKKAVSNLEKALIAGRVKPKISPKGGIAFEGWTEAERDDVTDACAYRRIMSSGSMMAKHAISKAEQMAGRSVNPQTVASGHHSHDGGQTWSSHKH